MRFIERARAKVNLTLHVPHRRADGWHELESLVVFAGLADRVTLDMDRPLGLVLDGMRMDELANVHDNLVMRAAHALNVLVPDLRTGEFTLNKHLPIAAGVGGGSADAAAALRLLARANGLSLDDPRLFEAAREIGADVSVCLVSRATIMRGVGDILGPVLKLPPLYAVLVNPGVPLETKAVFARMGLAPGQARDFGPHPAIASGISASDLFDQLRHGRNDMEDAASVLAPVIGDVLAGISGARGCRLARMSGSGATCFGLFSTRHAAQIAARVIRRDHPKAWAHATFLR